jgi:hypothetical protein
MSCNDKISDRCVNKTNAKCVTYEGLLADNTTLTPNCLDLETVLEDINEQINYLYDTTDVDGLSADTCIDYPDQVPQAKVTPKTAITTLNSKVKEVMTFVGMACDGAGADCPAIFTQDLSCLNLDFGTLVDPCGNQPTTLKDVLQLILTTIQPVP